MSLFVLLMKEHHGSPAFFPRLASLTEARRAGSLEDEHFKCRLQAQIARSRCCSSSSSFRLLCAFSHCKNFSLASSSDKAIPSSACICSESVVAGFLGGNILRLLASGSQTAFLAGCGGLSFVSGNPLRIRAGKLIPRLQGAVGESCSPSCKIRAV